jgi:hypothetical protein
VEMALAQMATLEVLNESHNWLGEFHHFKLPAFSGISNRKGPCLGAATNITKMVDYTQRKKRWKLMVYHI